MLVEREIEKDGSSEQGEREKEIGEKEPRREGGSLARAKAPKPPCLCESSREKRKGLEREEP